MSVGDESASCAAILDTCDRLLGVVARRQHRFSWLRAPGGGGWWPVDAYYPARRLLVLCREMDDAEAQTCMELATGRRLRVVRLHPAQLPADPGALEQALRERLGGGSSIPPPAPAATPAADGVGSQQRAWSRISGSMALAAAPRAPVRPAPPGQAQAAQRAARHLQTAERPPRPAAPAPAGRRPPPAAAPPRVATRAPGRSGPARGGSTPDPVDGGTALLLLALGVALVAELYLVAARLAVVEGQWLLAFGLSLDVAARSLGTVAAHRARSRSWSWRCALLGSPAVAAFAVFSERQPPPPDPAPLAAITALLAMVAVVLALIGMAVGI